jgi:nucleoside-diphosphate-sugar epimerase
VVPGGVRTRRREGGRVSEILVTGGNGFVGRHVVAALQERDEDVRVLALPGEDTAPLEERGVTTHRGDIRWPETLVAPMQGVDAVVHLAAMMDVWRPFRDYHAVNVAGTENVCRAALATGVRRVVHMSSSSVYGMALGRPADESFPLAPFRDPYPITKALGDQVVQRMAREDGLPAVIVRPDQIFGPGDRLHFGRMADRLRKGTGVVVGSGRNAMPLVYVSDAVRGLLLALDHERAVGQAYNIGNDRPLTQAQLLGAIAREIGARPPRLHLPYRALYAAGWAAERVAALGRSWHRPPITRLGVAFFGTDNRYAIEKARNELGYRPRVDLLEGVRHAAAWYDAGGSEGSAGARAGELVTQEAGA